MADRIQWEIPYKEPPVSAGRASGNKQEILSTSANYLTLISCMRKTWTHWDTPSHSNAFLSLPLKTAIAVIAIYSRSRQNMIFYCIVKRKPCHCHTLKDERLNSIFEPSFPVRIFWRSTSGYVRSRNICTVFGLIKLGKEPTTQQSHGGH